MAEQKLGGYSSRYRFTGKELDPLSGLYDFGARYYDPRLSVWFGVDPMADGHPDYAAYLYTANNPIVYFDPDGQDWVISKSIINNKEHYTIGFKGAILNSSGSKLDMAALKKNLTASIANVYNSQNIEGGATVSVNIDLRVITSESEIQSNDHLISVYSNSEFESITEKGVTGVADAYGKKIGISENTANAIICGDNSRTVPHELGHTAGLQHPDVDPKGLANYYDLKDDNNLMYGRSKGGGHQLGSKLKSNQIESMYNNFKSGKLNKNTIFNNGIIERIINWKNGKTEISKTYNDF
ncbi:MAG: RHS repeat-associated core domain-containing protein [Saprospiraceae bacterium]|nr:RHS repeat-associated core domain-containing protein [Saprospiraceae bacterium]